MFEQVTFSFSIFIPKKHNRWNGSGMTDQELPNFYCRYIPATIRAISEIYKGSKIIIYHNEIIYNSFYGAVLNELDKIGVVKLIPVYDRNGVSEAMLWRMKALWDAETRYVFMRDIDYLPTPRERVMIEQFMKDETVIHAINDCSSHSVPMMGGMIGFDRIKFCELSKYKNWNDLLSKSELDMNVIQSDQRLINARIWQEMGEKSSTHRLGWKPAHTMGKEYTSIPKPAFEDLSEEILQKGDTIVKVIGSCDYSIFDAVKLYDTSNVITQVEEKLNFYMKEPHDDTDTPMGICFKKTGSTLITLPHNRTRRKKVLFSITDNEDYAFFAPIVSCMWNEYVGFTPIVFIVGKFEEWHRKQRFRLVLDKILEVGGEIHFIDRVPGILDSTVAQVSRVFPFHVDYNDEQYVLTSDADMIPMSKTWYHNVDSTDLHLFYADAYNYTKFPICYIGAKIKTWKKIMAGANLNTQLSEGLGSGKIGMEAWCYDEDMFGKNVHSYIKAGGTYQYIFRGNEHGLAKGRVDRAGWKFDKSKTDYIDCHSLRPAQDGTNWDRVLELISNLLPERIEWFKDYRTKYINS